MPDSKLSTIDIPTEEAILRDLCSRSFYHFFQEFWETIEPGKLIANFHIKLICDELQAVYERWERGESQDDVLINVPPGSSKSTIVSQLFPCWLWVKNPGIATLCTSYKEKLSIKSAGKVRDCLKSEKFQRVFPNRIVFRNDNDGKTGFKNTSKGDLAVSSTGGDATGNHYHFIIIDDPLSVKLSASEKSRESADDYINTSLVSRKKDFNTTVTIMVMQRLHEDDPAGIWLRNKKLNHICLPAEVSEHVRPASAKAQYQDGLLDKNRKSREVLSLAKKSLGSYGYAGQFQQQPAPAEGGLLKKHWFQKASWSQFLELTKDQKVVWEFDADTAYRKNTARDPSAIMASAYVNGTLYIREVQQQWLALPQLLSYIGEFVTRNEYTTDSRLYVEPKASGIDVVEMLRANSLVNVMEAPSPGAGNDKIVRVNAISPFIESQRVVVLDGSWNKDFLDQCSVFPNGSHDDMVDCLSQRINRILQQQQQPQKRKANVY